MHVSEILERKGSAVATVKCDTTVKEAVSILSTKGYGALVVSDDGVKVDGIISERDVVRRLSTTDGDISHLTVSELMTKNVFTCTPEDTVEGLMERMTEHRIRHLPVCIDEVLSGLISIGDVVRARLVDLEEERRHLEGYIQQTW